MRPFDLKIKDHSFKIKILGICFSFKLPNPYLVKYIEYKRLKWFKEKIRLLRQKDKIKVVFLVSEQAKWTYQTIYDAFEGDERFIPSIVVVPLRLEHKGASTYYDSMVTCYDFFKNKGLRVEWGYDRGRKKYIPLNKLNADIVFYQQPWDLDRSQHPQRVSKYALTCYSAMGMIC